MNIETVYFSATSVNFSWGIHGFTDPVTWEDIRLHEKTEMGFNNFVNICICTKLGLESTYQELKNDEEESRYVNNLLEYLSSDSIYYWLKYDDPNDEDFHEVTFEAERNEDGVKPSYIEIWHPAQTIDLNVIDECVKSFCKKYYKYDVAAVLEKNPMSISEVEISFIESMIQFGKINEIVFSDELIEKLKLEWNCSRTEVLELLERSIR